MARVMVVEDEGIVAMELEQDLQSMGHEVVGLAADGPAALELFQRHRPDLVMCDINIQGSFDGIETSRQIRELGDTPIIFLTAYSDEATLQRARAVRPHGYLLKPFDERQIQITIDLALERAVLERETRQARDAARAMAEEIESLLHVLAHDVRSPLRALSHLAHKVLMEVGDQVGDTLKARLGDVRTQVGELDDRLEGLLALGQVSARSVRREAVDLTAASRSLVGRLRQEYPHRVGLTVEDGLTAMGDPSLVRLVLDNLLSNAFKYTAETEGAQVSVGQRETADGRAFYVRDNGAGIPEEMHSKVFLPFQSAHSRDTFRGHGVGLTSVRRVVSLHGGRIWVESQPGKGTTMLFTLPDRP